MTPKIERIDHYSIVGEGPHWDVATQSLYYVDVLGNAIQRYDPATKNHYKAVVGNNHTSAIIPIDGAEDRFLLGHGDNLAVVTWDGKSETVTKVKEFCHLNGENMRYNDAKCDPTGRFWAGTICGELDIIPKKGSLYSIDHEGARKEHLSELDCSNGLIWCPESKKFYFIDSFKLVIEQYDFDEEAGTISNRQTIFTLPKHGIEGFADGMTVDTDGNLWVAVFNGHCVLKIDPREPEKLIEKIKLPAREVTSLAFGGPNLDELYVTTGSVTFGGVDSPPPDNGALYKITETCSEGYPGVKAKINIL